MQKRCCSERYHVILTDINMPRMDGITAAKHVFLTQKSLRQDNSSLPQILIVAITAYETLEIQRECRDAGMADCLFKPVSEDQFISIKAYIES